MANGATVLSEGLCPSVSLKIQGHLCTMDFYLLPLGGCDVVLGVEWLRTLGPVLWDFQPMTMEFGQGSHRLTLQGLTPLGFTLEDGIPLPVTRDSSCNLGLRLFQVLLLSRRTLLQHHSRPF